jgi:hypothetical protein
MVDSSSFRRIEDPRQIEKIRALERDLGVVVLVLEPKYRPAVLTNEQLKRLAELEQELRVALVAYEPGYEIRAPLPEEESLEMDCTLDEAD